MKVDLLKSELKKASDHQNKRMVRRNDIIEELKLLTKKMDDKTAELKTMDLIEVFLKNFASFKKRETVQSMNELGTFIMQSVFGMEYSLIVREKEGKVTILVGEEIEGEILELNPEDENGGGIADIVSLAMRFIVLNIISNPPIDGPLLLDEPGRNVSAEYSSNMAKLISVIAKDFDRQIILNTHKEDLMNPDTEMDAKTYRVTKTKGKSKVVCVL